MLDGFIEPLSHFRVFPTDRDVRRRNDLGRALPPLPGGGSSNSYESRVPTDRHLREFAQLEAQVKAATQQLPPSAVHPYVSPHALSDAAAGSLVECFAFYTRLMTAESFTWPDFLATVFTKLAEHFATFSNEYVQQAIVDIFQQSAAHVAQVNEASKLISHVTAVLTSTATTSTPSARARALQLFATMPTLLETDAAVHTELVTRLEAVDATERTAAIAATRALLVTAAAASTTTLRHSVYQAVLASTRDDPALLALLPVAVRDDATDAQQAWNHCGVRYYDSADAAAAIGCLETMTALVVQHPTALLAAHVALLQHALQSEPRTRVQVAAVDATRTLFDAPAVLVYVAVVQPLVHCIVDVVVVDSPRANKRSVQHAAMQTLERWCSTHALDADVEARVVDHAVALHRARPLQFGAAAATLLTTIVQYVLQERSGQNDDQAQMTLSASEQAVLTALLELLHPRWWTQAPRAWTTTLERIEALGLAFPAIVADDIVNCLIELLELSTAAPLAMTTLLYESLTRLAATSREVVAQHAHVLEHALAALSTSTDNDTTRARAALAVALLRVIAPGDAAAASTLEQLLVNSPYATQADRYAIAKLAMTHGHFALARVLLSRVVDATASESFGSWLRALAALSDAEASMQLDSYVNLDAIYQLARAATYLDVATTAHFSFAFQRHVLTLRAEWMQLVLETQQCAGEAAFSNVRGAMHEHALRDRFVRLAARYRLLRSALLGASTAALDALDALAQLSTLLALAIDAFLLLRTDVAASNASLSSLVAGRLERSHNARPSPLQQTCDVLEVEIGAKAALLQRMDATRRAALGGTVIQQLLRSVCAQPLALPAQFFRLSMRSPQRRFASNVQFLTFVERSAFTTKPRPRSQLGVPFGTDFTSQLKGVLEVCHSAQAFWRDMVDALEIDVRVRLVDTSATVAAVVSSSTVTAMLDDADSAVFGHIHTRIAVDWSKARARVGVSSANNSDKDSASLFLAFETPVHVAAASLRAKGSFELLATVTAVDTLGGKWLLAPTGCSRGFIVY